MNKIVSLQLLLILGVVYLFDIEGQRHFLPILCLMAAGFLIHANLPRRFRLAFFSLLSLAGIILYLGWLNGACVIGIGAGLIAVTYLPVPFSLRVALLAVGGLMLVMLRIEQPAPFWPVLGSMFMFRLIVYVFEIRHERSRQPLLPTLAYFFPLPNVCFPLFPVLDYRTFQQTYYDEDEHVIHQTGVTWIVRGVVHLLLYRAIKYYVLPQPYEIRDLWNLLLFMTANYALYLRVSGWFHLITGMLHLYGFNLPRTHDNYFLASSFSDIWRRINIYWKDFMTRVFFFPAYYRLRGLGTHVALSLAALWVFLWTWLLHSYQVFWLLGELPLTKNDFFLWLTVGVLVSINLHFDMRRDRGRPRNAGLHSLRVVGMFLLISLFWARWTIPEFFISTRALRQLDSHWTSSAVWVLALLAVVAAIGILAQRLRPLLPRELSFTQTAALQTGILMLLLAAGMPQTAALLGREASSVVATLRQDTFTPVESAALVRGYYEEIAAAPAQSAAFGMFSSRDQPRDDGVHYIEMTRPSDDFMERELIPGWSGKMGGSFLSLNRLGMRDREGIEAKKPAGTYRIALVGSSIVMGYGVEDHQTFARLLEDQLNAERRAGMPRFEVLNFGMGLSYVIHRRTLIDRKVLAFEPNAIFYFAHQDELVGPSRHLTKIYSRGNALPYPCLSEVIQRAGVRRETAPGAMDVSLQPFGRDIVLGMYREMVQECRTRNILPVWVYLPMPGITEISVRSSDMVNLAKEAGWIVIDLADWAAGRTPAEVKLSPTDHHANARGHLVIAEKLFAVLRAREDLRPVGAAGH